MNAYWCSSLALVANLLAHYWLLLWSESWKSAVGHLQCVMISTVSCTTMYVGYDHVSTSTKLCIVICWQSMLNIVFTKSHWTNENYRWPWGTRCITTSSFPYSFWLFWVDNSIPVHYSVSEPVNMSRDWVYTYRPLHVPRHCDITILVGGKTVKSWRQTLVTIKSNPKNQKVRLEMLYYTSPCKSKLSFRLILLNTVRLKDWTETTISQVCSTHFITGKVDL